MAKSKRDDKKNVSLHLGSSVEDTWEQVLLPWFKNVATNAFLHQPPAIVITPSRNYADFLRRKLLARETSLLGVQFLNPPQLRELLLRGSGLQLPMREHLRLLLAIAAEEIARRSDRSKATAATTKSQAQDVLIAKSIARDPDKFLRAIDQLRAAGGELDEIVSPILAEIATHFEKLVRNCGFTLVHEADRYLVKASKQSQSRFHDLLVVGFNGAHWSLWPLLSSSVRYAQKACAVLNDPRDEARDIDETWIGTWEEEFGAAMPIPAVTSERTGFAGLTQSLESMSAITSRKNNPCQGVHFLIGHDTTEQARAIANLTVSFLSETSCQEVGILFSGAGALPRLVAQTLETLGIPNNDSIAHNTRSAFDDEEWRAWLELQNRPQLGPLLCFLQQSPVAVSFFYKLALREIERKLRHACGDILINDVGVLAEYCSRQRDEKFSEIAHGLCAIRLLPEAETFSGFLRRTLSIFRELKWRERAAELERLSEHWSAALTVTFEREHFLRWLTEIFVESALGREPNGDHPYARVQLLRYDQAENQSWSHLILAGLNEGVWPERDDESPFLPDEEIAAFNARILNLRAMRQGRFGAGQTTVRDGASLCLGARERREMALRQLLNAIESTRTKVAVTAQLYTSSPREQAVNPSEFVARLYFTARGLTLSQEEIERIHDQTRDWLARTRLFEPTKRDDVRIAQTRLAYDKRRTPDKFGEYEFAFRENSPPAREISLSATAAARLFTSPALVWMKVFLGIESDELNTTSWNLATGQWVHRWLATIGHEPRGNRFVSSLSPGQIVQRATNSADDFRNAIVSILTTRNQTMPDWWASGWRNARYLTERFANEVGCLTNWPQLAAEWQLDSPQVIPVNGHELRVRGRIDLLLARGDSIGSSELWIVDYKTGIAMPLKSQRALLRKQLLAGNGIQICIYALALRALGWREIGASLLTRETDLDGPQVTISDLEAQNNIWKQIAAMEKSGIFGMLGELRSEFTFTGNYPLAMLPIDKDLLREKWERTHPAFAAKQNNE